MAGTQENQGSAIFALSDGRRIKIRSILPSDRDHLIGGLAALSPKSRMYRFHGERTTFTEDELDHLVGCDGQDRLADVAVGLDESGEEVIGVGVARAYRNPNEPESAEVAIVVIDDWQRLGVGRLLLSQLAWDCSAAGIHNWTGQLLSENDGAEKLFCQFGSIVERKWERGVQTVTLKLYANYSDEGESSPL